MQKSIEVLKIICYTDFGEFNNCANVERSVSCANKKIVVALFLTALLIVCSFVDARGNNQPVSLQSNLAETLVDTRDADPTFDAHEAMSEDIWRQLESASKEAVAAYDGLTGEITGHTQRQRRMSHTFQRGKKRHLYSCENLPCLTGKSLAHPAVSAVNTGSKQIPLPYYGVVSINESLGTGDLGMYAMSDSELCKTVYRLHSRKSTQQYFLHTPFPLWAS